MEITAESLELVLFSPRNPDPRFLERYESAYALWKRVWGSFWESVGRPVLSSDSFIRQDDLCAIFRDDECVALTLQYVADFRIRSHREDSYFTNVFTPENHGVLETYGPKIYCGNHITTDPGFRQRSAGFSLKDVLLGACVECFLERDECRAMVGSMRADRGVTRLAQRFGAKVVTSYFARDYQFDLDLVVFERPTVHRCLDEQAREIVAKLWSRRIDARLPPPSVREKAA